MSRPHKRRSPREGGPRGATELNSTQHPASDRRTFQGVGNRRSAGQRAPRWTAPKGTDAAIDLSAALAPVVDEPKRFQVICTWPDGRRTLWCAYDCEKTAWTTAARLCMVAIAAEVVDARPTDTPRETR